MAIAWRKTGEKHPELFLYEFQCPGCGYWQGSWGLNRWEAQLDIECIKCGHDLNDEVLMTDFPSKEEIRQQEEDDAWADTFSREMENLEGIKETPQNELSTSEILLLAHSLIHLTEEYKNYDIDLELAKGYIYEAWKRAYSIESP